MLKRLALPAALAATLMVAACETAAPVAGPAITPDKPAAPAAAAFVPTLNIAATSSWQAEERLLPQRPILALVDGAGSVEKPAGFYMTCNPSNGVNTAHLGKQGARTGEAKFALKINKDAIALDGKFQMAGGDSELVFPLTAANVRTLAQATSAVIETDQGEAVWGFVTDPATAAALKAKHVASLKGIRAATDEYLVYCNPK